MELEVLKELREQFGHEKWLTDAEEREKCKTETQRRLDRNLYLECLKDNKNGALQLLEQGATNDYTHGNLNGYTPFHIACARGLLDVAKAIHSDAVF